MTVLVLWLPHLGRALALLALLFLPGWVMLRLAGMRGLLPLAAAPPVTLAVMALIGQACHWMGIRYSLVSLGLGLALCLLVSWGTARLVLQGLPAPVPQALPRPTRGTQARALGAALLAAVLLSLPILTQWDPTLPAQQIDSVFHYNLAWTITQTGDASLLTGASWSFSMRAIPAYYPLMWHALVATVASPAQVVATTNALVALVPLIWTLGMAALAAEALPTSRWAAAIAPLTMALLPAFPIYMLAYRQLWPNALGYAVLPAALALLCRSVRLLHDTGNAGRRRALIALLIFVVALGGAAATYPTAVFSILLSGLPLLAAIGMSVSRFVANRIGRRIAVGILAGAAIALALVSTVVILDPGILARLGRDTYAGTSGLGLRLQALVTLWPMGGGGAGYLVALGLHLLVTAGGLVVAVRRPGLRWIAWAWLLPMVLLAATYLPMGPLSALTGLWYNDPYRVIPLVLPAIGLLSATAVDALIAALGARADRRAALRAEPEGGTDSDGEGAPGRPGLRRPSPRDAVALLACAAVLVGGLSAGPARQRAGQSSYPPGSRAPVHMLTTEEASMIMSLRGKADPSLMVLGDPAAGAAYVQPLAGLRSVFPHVTYRSLDWDAQYLAENFSRIGQDPRVCELVNHYRIGYYYADEPGTVPGIDVRERAPGLYGVDTSQGFELVARAGSASVWRITACGAPDPVGQRDPWGLKIPYEPLLGPQGRPNVFNDKGEFLREGD
ncbi:DUF6541 domain-containing protein [Actinomyces slackii]|uniref:Uncharacterized protein n=1 Tax=Actinomyces slackii TaxID=52774 RepID=A0A448KG08_9ACTO|nr:DUF6541 family protein [Actinomyces slackii]VEG75883.1 Uncharacterised protein [Actinomyces slackii]